MRIIGSALNELVVSYFEQVVGTSSCRLVSASHSRDAERDEFHYTTCGSLAVRGKG